MTPETVETDAAWKQIAVHLDEAMNQIGDQDRLALLLRYYQRKPLREVGLALGIGEDAARMRVNRALEKLHGLLVAKGAICSLVLLGSLLTERTVQATAARTGQLIQAAVFQVIKRATLPSFVIQLLRIMAKNKLRTAGVVSSALLGTFTIGLTIYNQLQGSQLKLTANDSPPPIRKPTSAGESERKRVVPWRTSTALPGTVATSTAETREDFSEVGKAVIRLLDSWDASKFAQEISAAEKDFPSAVSTNTAAQSRESMGSSFQKGLAYARNRMAADAERFLSKFTVRLGPSLSTPPPARTAASAPASARPRCSVWRIGACRSMRRACSVAWPAATA